LFEEVDTILFGEFETILDKNDFSSAYFESSIYVDSNIDSFEEIAKSIIHEMFHALSSRKKQKFFFLNSLTGEFKSKRIQLMNILETFRYKVLPREDFEEIFYSKEFDDYLVNEIGYDNLANCTSGIFLSPYAATSFEDYVANGLESFFINERELLFRTSPELFDKINSFFATNNKRKI
jgi:hypothetical protein